MKKYFGFLLIFIFIFLIGCNTKGNEKPLFEDDKKEEQQETKEDQKEDSKESEQKTDIKASRNINKVNYSYDRNARDNDFNAIYYNQDYKNLMNQNLSMISSDFILDNLTNDNIVISPLSIYFALVLLTYTSDEEIKGIICEKLNLSESDLLLTKKLINSLITERLNEGRFSNNGVINRLDITNSIWVNAQDNYNEEVLKDLADDLYCYAYETDFCNNNKQANEDIQNFVKEKTHGLIDQDFGLDQTTIFTLINTIYFKTIWNDDGNKLPVENKDFTCSDGDVINADFLMGDYYSGKVYQGTNYQTFVTYATEYQIKFILPNENVSINEVFTKENIEKLNYQEYVCRNDESLERYHTRCLFPKFSAKSDIDCQKTLKEKYGLSKLFNSFTSYLTNANAFVGKFIHVAKIDVNEIGIEAAAVTIVQNCGEAGPDEYKDIYYDFVLDRPFGYIITDSNGIILFSGICNTIK